MKNKNDILDQMYSRNQELKNIDSIIEKCQETKKADAFKINVSWKRPPSYNGQYNVCNVEGYCFEVDDVLRERILMEMEKYYKESAERCNEELNLLLDNLKNL